MQYSKDHNSKKKKKRKQTNNMREHFQRTNQYDTRGETTHGRNTLLYPNNDIKQTSGLHKAT